jgi:hypothetical protein
MRLEQLGAHCDATQAGLGFFDFSQADDVGIFFDGINLRVCAVSFFWLILSLTTKLRSLLHAPQAIPSEV